MTVSGNGGKYLKDLTVFSIFFFIFYYWVYKFILPDPYCRFRGRIFVIPIRLSGWIQQILF